MNPDIHVLKADYPGFEEAFAAAMLKATLPIVSHTETDTEWIFVQQSIP